MKRILVLTDHMPWGHRSIALAIFDYLKSVEKKHKWLVEYAQVKAETGVGGDIYNFFYRYAPSANMWLHKATFNKTIQKLALEVPMANLPALKKVVDKFKPDLIISTYFMHSHCLSVWKKAQKLPFALWTVVADPWTINGVSLVDGADKNIFYDEVVEKMALSSGMAPQRLLKTGWWTRRSMYQKYDQQNAREKLGLSGTYPVIFIGGGSLGTTAMTKIMPILPFIKEEIGIILNCGTDKVTYRLMENYKKLFIDVLGKKNTIHIKNYGWLENIGEVIAAADIVFGKAGPNFLFDVVALEKPFVAISHISGQEDGNLELIKKKKLGWVKEDPLALNRFLLEYVKNPKKYNKLYQSSIQKEAKKNWESFALIEEEIKALS